MHPEVLAALINEILVKSTILGSEKSFVQGLTPKQLHIVMEIGTRTFRHGDLAVRLGVEPSTLTRTLNPLVQGGLADRSLNPDNRREVLIRLTEAGLSVLETANGKMEQIASAILGQVPKEQLAEVERSVRTLLDILRNNRFDP
ncbi:MarR family winged helix-turn-helix transcriptional regulator [Cohnella zeiphila]|uniref:MarR family transcriptional regulator n=1 Tax=Cohnella zeiphila TaxID=2761120 RepID=A0A7X0STR1_9BACL|nr:MarR family transcriptional regulator [Cohnella zeiphila]MBB6735979.1 MarR family transcriptional regulator [Cohnella zeiphila]